MQSFAHSFCSFTHRHLFVHCHASLFSWCTIFFLFSLSICKQCPSVMILFHKRILCPSTNRIKFYIEYEGRCIFQCTVHSPFTATYAHHSPIVIDSKFVEFSLPRKICSFNLNCCCCFCACCCCCCNCEFLCVAPHRRQYIENKYWK